MRVESHSHGERMDVSVLDTDFFDVNKLTVVASESYDSFAKALQNEIVESLSERPVTLTTEVLNNRVIQNEKSEKFVFDSQTSMDLIFDMRTKGYLDSNYHITETLIKDVENKTYAVPDKLKGFESCVAEIMTGIYTTANFKAAENENANNINEPILKPNDNFAKKEFQDLWKKIKVKTVYEVDFASQELVEKCVKAIDAKLTVKKILINITSGEQ